MHPAIALFERRIILTKLLHLASAKVYKLERFMLILLASLVSLLVLLNVVTRSLNYAIYWFDELAIYAMIWLVMIGASVTTKRRMGIRVTLLEEMVGESMWNAMLLIVDIIILLFGLLLIWLAWMWYDPFTFMAFGFDRDTFSAGTFNYIYDEPTLTIGVPKFLVWLVMPFTAITMSIHAAANLVSRRAQPMAEE